MTESRKCLCKCSNYSFSHCRDLKERQQFSHSITWPNKIWPLATWPAFIVYNHLPYFNLIMLFKREILYLDFWLLYMFLFWNSLALWLTFLLTSILITKNMLDTSLMYTYMGERKREIYFKVLAYDLWDCRG